MNRSLACLILFCACAHLNAQEVQPGAWNTAAYLPLLKNKKVAIVANPTSTIGSSHLVDTLKASGVKIIRIFAPEHGFRGLEANGEKVKDGKDKKTCLPVTSLYGKNVKPLPKDLKDVDLVVFDIQDVGVRYYTFLSTLHFIMEACAENNKPLLLLDRPNPNGYYIDGPILEDKYRSMVGMHPIPLVHGMTLGELARMINGERWLANGDTCALTVIPVSNWTHNKKYVLPVAPSPNLPSEASIILYPTLGLLEGTVMSMGRGTARPFECFGAPWMAKGTYNFTPVDIPGKALDPPFEGQLCKGFLVTDFAKNFLSSSKSIYLEWLVMLMQECPDKQTFFNPFFEKLAGTAKLREQLLAGKTAVEIRESWKPGVDAFLIKRKPYLMYDYESWEARVD